MTEMMWLFEAISVTALGLFFALWWRSFEGTLNKRTPDSSLHHGHTGKADF